MIEIPVIFCFDDRILTGAGVSILSMFKAAKHTTRYSVHVFHPGFSLALQAELLVLIENTCHKMKFHRVAPSRFADAPRNRGSWTEIVYYRLLASELLHEFDRAIYSDCDVFFNCDLTDIFAIEMDDCEWAGVAAERNNPNMKMHRYFEENTKDYVYFSGFMVMNLALMRSNFSITRYFDTIAKFKNRLKFFDLDVLNLATPKIARVPFEFVLLEDIFETENIINSADYCYLRSVYADEVLLSAREASAIVHFAGRRGKPWQRRCVPNYFAEMAEKLPNGLRRGTFRDFRKRWFSRKGNAKLDYRSLMKWR